MNPKGSKSGSRGLNPRQAGDTPGLFAESAASRRDARVAQLFNQRFLIDPSKKQLFQNDDKGVAELFRFPHKLFTALNERRGAYAAFLISLRQRRRGQRQPSAGNPDYASQTGVFA